ncbi:MAG: aminopeptidase P family N-terminal domain-containing protein, partial [Pseudomonadota bacterium]
MFQSFDPVSDKSFGPKHLPLLRERLTELGLDGFLVPHDDEYLNEYLPDQAERLMWLTGFSGSAGSAIVLKSKAAAFSDGRYAVQLPDQVDADLFDIVMTHDQTPDRWLGSHAAPGAKIGYDPMLFSEASIKPFETVARKKGLSLVAVRPNPIDEVWQNRPPSPSAKIYPHPMEFAGEDGVAKRMRIGKSVGDDGADLALLTAPSSLAWLFNIRGGDVHAAPLPLGRALIFADGKAELSIDPRKVTAALRDELSANVKLRPESEIEERLNELGNA